MTVPAGRPVPNQKPEVAPGGLLPLADCAEESAARVGRKAVLLGWAAAAGLVTPGGWVVPAERFRAALEAAGVGRQADYLQTAALRLDPRHVLELAAAIREAMLCPAVDAQAAAAAQAAWSRLGDPRVVCRSSAAMEDGPTAAFPGVFVSALDLASPAAVAAAIVGCWRSAFSADAIRYLLRLRTEPVDFSIAVLLQAQVEAAWYGVYVSADPLTGLGGPLADLSDEGPSALVDGARATLRARREGEQWSGIDGDPAVGESLEAVHRAALILGAHLDAEVDVEFALPGDGGEPVILQCRPITHRAAASATGADADAGAGAAGRLRGRACAGGRAVGTAVDARAGEVGSGDGPGIALVGRLTTADFGIVLGHAGVVMEQDASPLSHVAILCRELGVPFVCGIDGALARFDGRRVAVDGGSGEVEILDDAPVTPASAERTPPPAEATISALELLLRLLAEGRPGNPPEEARRIARSYARALGARATRVTSCSVAPAELEALERLGRALLGPTFSATAFLAENSLSTSTAARTSYG